LPDPERFISGRHGVIAFQNGDYYLSDVSTNGIFLNGASTQIGNDHSVKLNDGDTLQIGSYQVEVKIVDSQISQPSPYQGMTGQANEQDVYGVSDAVSGNNDSLDPMDFFTEATPEYSAPGAVDNNSEFGSSSLIPGDNDSLIPSDNGYMPTDNSIDDDYFGDVSSFDSSVGDEIQSPSESFVPPSASAGQIPDDWDELLGGNPVASDMPSMNEQQPTIAGESNAHIIPDDMTLSDFLTQGAKTGRSGIMPAVTGMPGQQPPTPPVQPPPMQPAPPPVQQQAPPPPVQQQPPMQSAPMPAGQSGDLLNAFMQGLGVNPQGPLSEDPTVMMRNFGEMFREVVGGMMDVLSARTSMKSEFRMEVTTIRPVENNPLKFSVGMDDAIQNLLFKRGTQFLQPKEAITEGFQDIKDHEMAMMAGMQATFTYFLKRFEPGKLEDQFEKTLKRASKITFNNRAKYWDLYIDIYNHIARDADDDFQRVFGVEFSKAYEAQIRKLAGNRRR